MSLHNAAKHLESKGRNGDSMLVHMTPGEVRGLQALALAKGGSLSVNPDTGLVEASFLKNLLPMVAGIGLNMMFPGLGALGSAALVGGFETARTGDLGKGLMAGLGAYGGAGIGQGLSAAGASAVPAGEVGASTLTEAGQPMLENTAKSNIQSAFNLPTTSTPIPGATSVNAGAEALKASVPQQAPITMGNMYRGLGQLGSEAGRDAFMQAAPKYTLPAAGIGVVNAATPEAKQPGPVEPDEYDKRLASYRLSPSFSGYTPPQPNPYYRPTGLGYAAGGDVMLAAGGSYEDEPLGDVETMASGGISHLPRTAGIPDVGIYRDTDVDTSKKLAWEAAQIRNKKAASAANIKLAKMPKTSIKGIGDIEEAATGGSIGGYSDGGRMLKGPGDGMSDSIPATIGRKQPARLADGEFVVPADVVSHLGNGSTDAGAKRLYAMMDKVRHARTGTKKQGKQIKAEKYMPA